MVDLSQATAQELGEMISKKISWHKEALAELVRRAVAAERGTAICFLSLLAGQ
jgi:hypothetical protein